MLNVLYPQHWHILYFTSSSDSHGSGTVMKKVVLPFRRVVSAKMLQKKTEIVNENEKPGDYDWD